ncbi:MAG: hypothetical protein Ct9H300mP28_10850 [Pseudomonadota bacterium]|nr:MAG: hypothetical protein Ct9H300mP28_10850 [Pseudomonadota bacterium]
MLGSEGQGFQLINEWLGPTRLTVPLQVLHARNGLLICLKYAATREQFGQKIGKFPGVSFPLAECHWKSNSQTSR